MTVSDQLRMTGANYVHASVAVAQSSIANLTRCSAVI